jgi:hypothetical protein
MEFGHQLEAMLGIETSGPVFQNGEYSNPFTTYSNVLDNHGCDSYVPRLDNLHRDYRIFRDLPNGGRRSPRSRMFCQMAVIDALPHVEALAGAEFCSSLELAENIEEMGRWTVDDIGLPSDSEVAKDIQDAIELGFFDHSYDENCDLVRAFCDGTTASISCFDPHAIIAHSRTEFWTQVGCGEHPELLEHFTKEYYQFLQDVDGNDFDGVDEFKEFFEQHLVDGSLHSAAVTARLSEFEDQYLASEAKQEADEDLRCAVLRLKEGTIEYAVLLPRPYSFSAQPNSVFISAHNTPSKPKQVHEHHEKVEHSATIHRRRPQPCHLCSHCLARPTRSLSQRAKLRR